MLLAFEAGQNNGVLGWATSTECAQPSPFKTKPGAQAQTLTSLFWPAYSQENSQ